jgi:hypothetical protein
MALINLIVFCFAIARGMATSATGYHRQVQAKAMPNWRFPPGRVYSENAQNMIWRPQNQRSQEQEIFPIENRAYTPSPGQSWTENKNSNLEMTQSPSNQLVNQHLSLGTVLFFILTIVGALFIALVIKRRQELARWREYRTHQILQAQDEAFDTNYDEAFDLELVEGSSQVTTS